MSKSGRIFVSVYQICCRGQKLCIDRRCIGEIGYRQSVLFSCQGRVLCTVLIGSGKGINTTNSSISKSIYNQNPYSHYYDDIASFAQLCKKDYSCNEFNMDEDFVKLCRVLKDKLNYLNHNELISLCTSLASLVSNKGRMVEMGNALIDLYHGLLQNVSRCYPMCTNSQLAHMAWCLVQWSSLSKQDNKNNLNQLAEVVRQRIDNFANPVHISKMIWALAKYNQNDDILRLLCQQAISVMDEFNPVSISMVCYSLALLSKRSESLLRAIENRLFDIVDILDAQSIANIAWAFAKLRWSNYDVFMVIKEQALASILKQKLNPQAVSNVAWAIASINIKDEKLLNACCNHFLHNYSKYSLDDICQLLYSLAKMHYQPIENEKFLLRIMRLLRQYVGNNYEVSLNNPKYHKQVINATWSLIVMKQFPPDLISYILSNKFIEVATCISRVEAAQLSQIDLATTLEAGNTSIQCLSPTNRRKFIKALQGMHTSPSTLEQDVVPAIGQLLGGERYYQSEVATPFGYTIDVEILLDKSNKPVAITNEHNAMSSSNKDDIKKRINSVITKVVFDSMSSNRRIAIEIDGPMHFIYQSNEYIGPDVMKTRHLSLLGWQVVRIPYYEWNALKHEKEIQNYLAKKLFNT